jgi:dCMP deaminase
MKQKFVDYYMKVAELTSTLSYAKRLQVGSVIVKGNKILATGYNGMPSGWDNECETTETVELDEKFVKRLVTKPEVLHSETNAIAKVSASTESSEGATMFCTHAPCINCAKLIYQSGINNLFYRDTYRDSAGIKFLESSGVLVTKYETQS